MILKPNKKKSALAGKGQKKSIIKQKKLASDSVVEKNGQNKQKRMLKLDDNDRAEEIPDKKKLKKSINVKSSEDEEKQNSGESKNKSKKRKNVKLQNPETLDDNLNSLEAKSNTQRKRKLPENEILDTDTDDSSDEETPVKKRAIKEAVEKREPENPEMKERTIFVGNIPLKCTKKQIKKHFNKFGIIDSIRIRGIPVANPKLPKKVAVIKQEFHPERNNCICYIRYKNKEDAIKAESQNGSLFEGHHLRVHSCVSAEKPDESKAIFIGNLSFEASEDELWKLFEVCGPISHVRIIRDTFTGMGKGFAYVNFQDNDAVQLALEMEDVKLRDRVLRISLCNSSVAKRNKKMKKVKEIKTPGQPKFRKPFNRNKNPNDGDDVKTGKDFKMKKKNANFSFAGKKTFQGSKFTDKKKKFKKNKGLAEKKRKIDGIAPKNE